MRATNNMGYDYDRSHTAARPIPIDKPALRGLAKRLVQLLPQQLQHLARGADPTLLDQPLRVLLGQEQTRWRLPLGKYSVNDVEGNRVTVQVMTKISSLAPPSGRWALSGGSVETDYNRHGPVARKTTLVIQIFDLRSPTELVKHLDHIEDEAFSILIHEATHLRDRLTRRYEIQYQGDVARNPGERETLYHNKRTEIRAFMQQVADEVISYAEGQPDLSTLTGVFLSQAIQASTTWKRIVRHLTTQNARLILRGVERALRQEWPRLLAIN